ncbi:MAG: hypothetical protein PHU80_05235 [Kiritimatiellae bacterium]|nr:hypothetical protein [Kiritimatiellia bacterium]
MENRTPCPVCKTPNVSHSGAGASTSEIHCPRCGRFLIQTLAETRLLNSPPPFPPSHLLSGLCRNTWDNLGEKLLVTVDMFQSWANLDKTAKILVPRDTDLPAKGDYLLKYIRRKSKSLADTVSFTPAELSVGFCANKKELLFCLSYLSSKGLVEEEPGNQKPKGAANAGLEYRLTPAGWLALDVPATATEPMAAVALSLENDTDTLWSQGFAAAAQKAGYKAVRIDSREHANKINDEMIVGVRHARILVADLSGQSPLAYFQAGLAAGLGKPVFWTCEERAAQDKKLHLEIRQHLVTTWSNDKLDDFALRLCHRIEAALGRP